MIGRVSDAGSRVHEGTTLKPTLVIVNGESNCGALTQIKEEEIGVNYLFSALGRVLGRHRVPTLQSDDRGLSCGGGAVMAESAEILAQVRTALRSEPAARLTPASNHLDFAGPSHRQRAAALYATFRTRQLRGVQPQLFDDSQHDAVRQALAGSHQGNFRDAAFAPHSDTSVTEVLGPAAWHLVEMAAPFEQPLSER